MGQDGLRGCEAIREAGGQILAQDEATQRGLGHAGLRRARRAGRPGAAARRDRRRDRRAASSRPRRPMPAAVGVAAVRHGHDGDRRPADFDYVRDAGARRRPAIVLEAGQGVPGRGAAGAARAPAEGSQSIGELVARLRAEPADGDLHTPGRRGDGHQRDVVLPRPAPVRGAAQARAARADREARGASARLRIWCAAVLDRPGAVQPRHAAARALSASWPAGTCSILATDLSQRGAGARARGALQPDRGQPRPAGAAAGEVLRAARQRAGSSRPTSARWSSSGEINLAEPWPALPRDGPGPACATS